MTASHTPGPWLRTDTADYAEIHSAFRPSSQAVALVGKPEDADLIACAPELLSIVRRFIALPGGSWHPVRHAAEEAELMHDARAVIAKATASHPSQITGEQ
ncbi:MAG TPA: hypothetical protein PKD99_12400 [Sphingopyxis sp.]|nr:hypothetical protein [Sphingopyxis sp.]HMP45899.1 hypothetical protein [Sphingopyxis sp.]